MTRIPDPLMAELSTAKAELRTELLRGRKGSLIAERVDEIIDRYQRALKDAARHRHRHEAAEEIRTDAGLRDAEDLLAEARYGRELADLIDPEVPGGA